MGVDLVSACIFCAGLLLGMDIPPRLGLGGEMGFSYATLARRLPVAGDGTDSSDVTPKFALVGMGNARQPSEGLGAGTPAFQWAARVTFAPSHDQQFRGAYLSRVVATGTGRYENFAVLGRLPIGGRDSVEVAVNRRAESATDLVNIGEDIRGFSEERTLSASRGDAAIGWRHRWERLEASAAFRYSKPSGYDATEESFQQASGGLAGAEAEVRLRSGRWTLLLHGESMGGSLDVHRESAPDFADRDAELPASFTAARLGVGYFWPRTELFLTGTYDRQKLPFVSLAVLGAETLGFDGGEDPNSVNEEIYANLGLRYKISPSIALRVSVVLGWGTETVTLTDSAGVIPAAQLDVLRRGIFGGGLSGSLGSPEVALFIGADFAIGGPH
jgi:hypothetical protein